MHAARLHTLLCLASHGAHELVWLHALLTKLDFQQTAAAPLMCDSNSMVTFSGDPSFHSCMKHVPKYEVWHWGDIASKTPFQGLTSAETSRDVLNGAAGGQFNCKWKGLKVSERKKGDGVRAGGQSQIGQMQGKSASASCSRMEVGSILFVVQLVGSLQMLVAPSKTKFPVDSFFFWTSDVIVATV